MRALGILLVALTAWGQIGQFPPGAGTSGAGGGGGQYSTASAAYAIGTTFLPPGGGQAANATEANVQVLAPVAGTYGNLSAKLTASPGIGNTVTFTFRDAGADTLSTCSIAGAVATTCTDSNTFSVALHDALSIKVVVTGGTVTAGIALAWSIPGQQGPQGIQGAGFIATSTTALSTAGSGSKVFTTQSGLAYSAGARVRATSAGTGEWMEGVVASYSVTTLTVTMDKNSGTGTHGDWNINAAGQPGADGVNGSNGTNGANGSNGANGAGYTATSTTSLVTAGSGSKAFTTQSGLAYTAGARVRATSAGTGEWMEGVIATYVSTTLTVTMDSNSGTGTHADWNLNVAGQPGATGPAGPAPSGTGVVQVTSGTPGLVPGVGTDCVRVNGTSGSCGSGGGGSSAYTTVSFASTPTFTVTASTNVQDFKIILTGNVTSSTLNLASATTGQDIAFHICQDGTGGRTFTWPTNVVNPGTPDPTLNVCSKQIFRYDGTNAVSTAGMTSDNSTPGTFTNTGVALAYPTTSGTLIGTGDTGTVSNGMLAGSIPNSKLANPSVTVNGQACVLGSTCAVVRSFSCSSAGLGDGVNALAAASYLQTNCYNSTGSTVTITGVKCFSDNNGTSTCNATNGGGTGLLTGAVTATNSYASGTQSGTTTLANGDFIKFTFVADGTSKQMSAVVIGTW